MYIKAVFMKYFSILFGNISKICVLVLQQFNFSIGIKGIHAPRVYGHTGISNAALLTHFKCFPIGGYKFGAFLYLKNICFFIGWVKGF